MTDKTISELKEKKLINEILNQRDQLIDTQNNQITQSYHDDAAIQLNTTKYTILTTDMLIQKSHFPKEMTYFQMGQKVVTVNVSDILAMNAKPESILIAMGLPKTLKVSEYKELVDGILDKCKKYNITLIGGDINQDDQIVLTGTATGIANENIKLQTGIKPNNLIAVTGKLGSPAAAFELLNNPDKYKDISEDEKNEIINTLLEPTVPIKTSETLRKYPEMITSITDITDGLASELGQLQQQNKNIGFNIEKDNLPYNRLLEVISKKANINLNEYLYHFGEEFELLITLDKDEYEKHKTELSSLYIIGRTNDTKQILETYDNKTNIIQPRGYEHL